MPIRTVTPAELARSTDSGSPRRLRVQPERASLYASRLDLRLHGPDFEINSFRPLSALDEAEPEDRTLTYLTSRQFAPALAGRRGLTVVTTPGLLEFVPPENGVLLTGDQPLNSFYSILEVAGSMGLFERLETFISGRAVVSATAIVSPNVHVSDHAEIAPGAVILPNTYIGPGVVVNPNAVIGGDGFAPTTGNGRRIVSHVGGVWLAAGVRVGSSNCIDKGLWGDFTEIGSDTILGNLIIFAHGARAGRHCSIVASAAILGSVRLGEGVWVGPHTSVNQNLHIASHCYIGTGSVITRDIEAYSLAYGIPAKVHGWVCECRTKLSFKNDRAQCDVCAKTYVLEANQVRRQ